MKLWAQTNNSEEDAKKILSSSPILEYGLSRIQLADTSYPAEMDFSTPLAAESLTDEDFKNLAPEKKTRGLGKRANELQEARDHKKRLIGKE